jgi:hypothetical protein
MITEQAGILDDNVAAAKNPPGSGRGDTAAPVDAVFRLTVEPR